MTACLHYSPEREARLLTLAQQIGQAVRAHRKRLGLTHPEYQRRFNVGRLGQIENGRVPNFTLLMAIKMLDITGAGELRIVPKEGA